MPLMDKPRKGTYDLWNIAQPMADEIGFLQDELFPSGIEKIECRFLGVTPEFIAIVHTKDGKLYAIRGNSEYLSEEDYKEIGFNPEKYPRISDSIACSVAVYYFLLSDITKEEFDMDYKIDHETYNWIKKIYNDHTADFII